MAPDLWSRECILVFPICVTTVPGCPPWIVPACRSHASFWTKYIFRAVMKSELHAPLSQQTHGSHTFHSRAARLELCSSVSAKLNESLFILVNCTLRHE